jgi:ClpP class serine protease
MKRQDLRVGEYLAIDAGVLHHDAAGFFMMIGPDAPDNERVGSVCVIHVRGALSQFKTDGGDSYEAIVERVKCAIEYDPPPSSILFRISSPGGVVAGLNECVLKLQRMSKEAKIPLVAYVDELAASAAYALCCACSEVLAPPSAVIGSVGTIATMVSQAAADKQMGLDYRLIVSGKRKADGHPHSPIPDDAVKAETARNTQLAAQFFALAGKARGLAPAKLESLEAAIYLGKDAKRVGLIDDVETLDNVLYGLDTTDTPPPPAPSENKGNVTDRRAKESVPLDKRGTVAPRFTRSGTTSGTPREASMPVKLDALIKRTAAALAASTDPKERVALQAKVAAYAVAKADSDGDGDDDDGPPHKGKGEEDDEDSKAAKAAEAAKKAKKTAEASKHRAKAAEYKQKAAESEEAAKAAEEDDEESEEEESRSKRSEEEARAASLSPGAAAALASEASVGREALARVEKLEKSAAAREHSAMIAEAKAQRRVTAHEAKMLASKSLSFVTDFLSMRPNPLVVTEDNALLVPDGRTGADIGAEAMKSIDAACAAAPSGTDKAALREKLLNAHRAAQAQANGAQARY